MLRSLHGMPLLCLPVVNAAVCRPAEVASAVQGLRLQQPTPQEDEMEDVRWFHRWAWMDEL